MQRGVFSCSGVERSRSQGAVVEPLCRLCPELLCPQHCRSCLPTFFREGGIFYRGCSGSFQRVSQHKDWLTTTKTIRLQLDGDLATEYSTFDEAPHNVPRGTSLRHLCAPHSKEKSDG